MSQLVIPKIECTESKDNFARFVAEPLEKGLGITMGNTMRRVLLSSLPGAAVTKIRIDGIQHEFSTIPHVKEDVVEFILNVRGLRIKPVAGQPGKLTLDVEGEKQVFAGDIKPSVDFEVVNPELYLAALDSSKAKLYAEFDVELGKGYQEAGPGDNLPIGVIPVDAIFSPVRKVNFSVEPVHVGQEAGRERLQLEVWTDGTISPADAISRAADILIEQLSPFVNYTRISQEQAVEKEPSSSSIPAELFNMPVEQLNLSVRTMNCLRRGAITTVGELVSKEERDLLNLRNLGQKSMQEIKERLAAMGLSLAGEATEIGELTETSEAAEGDEDTTEEKD
ncbi:MAG: DNA-directed RNA polymerase subunit alpha [Chloroflexota bacterium]